MYQYMISVKELLDLQKRKRVLLVDLRSSEAFRKGHIPFALSVPNKEETNFRALSKGYDCLVFYCERGITSARFTLLQRKMMLNAFSLNGGYTAYGRFLRK